MGKTNLINTYRNIFISIILLITLNSSKCDENKLKNKKVDCGENNIGSFIQLQLSCNKDSVSFGETVMYNLSFINKTDSILRFYPKVRMLICKEPCAYGPLNETSSKLFSDTVDITKIVDIKPKELYISQYKVLICQETLSFFEKGINDVHILFIYDSIFQNKRKSTNPNAQNIKFCGSLKSNEIRIIIK